MHSKSDPAVFSLEEVRARYESYLSTMHESLTRLCLMRDARMAVAEEHAESMNLLRGMADLIVVTAIYNPVIGRTALDLELMAYWTEASFQIRNIYGDNGYSRWKAANTYLQNQLDQMQMLQSAQGQTLQ